MWTTLVALFSRLGFTWARRRLDEEARAEFAAHVDLLVERYIRSGMTPAEARATVLRQASVVLRAGLLAGTLGALMRGRWLTSLALEISPSDPRILLAAAVLLATMGLVAAWLPARRASRVAPRIAMQEAH